MTSDNTTTQQAPEKLCMSVDEMARALGVSRNRAFELVKTDGFPVIRFGRRLLVPVAGLERWIETQSDFKQGR